MDGQLVERTVAELRAMPNAGDLLVQLERVVEATRTVVGVDGTGLTLIHADGPPRWVAVSDAAMQLLEEVQHDFGEGPCLAAFTENRVVAVQDLASELIWDRIAVVVRQLRVRGVLSVPVRLADQPVGTLNVYATQPRAWSPAEVQALGAFAMVTAELVHTAVELANHQVELAQLRQALPAESGLSRPRGCWPPPKGSPWTRRSSSCRCGRGRRRAGWPRWPKRSSSKCSTSGSRPRRSTTPGSGRPRCGLGRPNRRCRGLGPGWPDAPQPWTEPKMSWPRASEPLTSATGSPMTGTRAADDRNHLADARERAADVRDRVADARDRTADKRDRDHAADQRHRAADQRHRAADQRDRAADEPE
jgi:hypothetical protein